MDEPLTKSEHEAKTGKIEEIDRLLLDCYGDRSRGHGNNDLLDGLVMTILSQNTSDTNSRRAFENLKREYPEWHQAAEAGRKGIERAIRSGGISRVKAERIEAILETLKGESGSCSLEHLKDMEPRRAMDYLTDMPGVGRKTAAVLLLFYLGYPFFPVDTHVFRVGRRLGLIPPKSSTVKAHDLMDGAVPDDIKYRFHVNLITHGRRVCRARKPNCRECCLINSCERVGVEEKGNENA